MGAIMRIIIILVLNLCFPVACGCPNSVRRRRSVDLEAPDIDSKLADFFGNCQPLVTAANGILPSLQSAVDYVIRDTNWYKHVRENRCSGVRNVAECWIAALDFLIDFDSKLLAPTARCMCDWAKSCWSPSFTSHSLNAFAAGQQTNWFSNCLPNRQSKPLTLEQKTVASCINAQARTLASRYTSINRLEMTSVEIFLQDHYTYCKSIPDLPYKQRNLFALIYSEEVCPRTGANAVWRKDFNEVIRMATRDDGPVRKAMRECGISNGNGEKLLGSPQLGAFGEWSKCSVTCGVGMQTRSKRCTRPPCPAPTTEQRQCREQACQVNGLYSRWGVWSRCSTSCGSGMQFRTRQCMRVPCTLPTRETRQCTNPLCQNNGMYTAWSDWSQCSVTCGTGKQMRRRQCVRAPCNMPTTDTRACNNPRCTNPVPVLYVACVDSHQRCRTAGARACLPDTAQYCRKTCNLC